MNPYIAPRAKVEDPAAGARSAVLAIAAGAGLYLAGVIASTTVLRLVFGSEHSEQLVTPSIVVGFCFSACAGYACARMAGRSELRLAAVATCIGVLFNALFLFPLEPFLQEVELALPDAVVMMAAAAFGKWRNRRSG